jgi:carbon-monoxide dehydrogenase small subunit
MTAETYRLTVNGTAHDVPDAWIGENLLHVLRERLGLPGAKNACEQGECGARSSPPVRCSAASAHRDW